MVDPRICTVLVKLLALASRPDDQRRIVVEISVPLANLDPRSQRSSKFNTEGNPLDVADDDLRRDRKHSLAFATQ